MNSQLINLLCIILLSSCSCKSLYIKNIEVLDEGDKYLNCNQLALAIEEAKYLSETVSRRIDNPKLFSNGSFCIRNIKMDAEKTLFILKDRIQYLENLSTLKKCKTKEQENFSYKEDKSSQKKREPIPVKLIPNK